MLTNIESNLGLVWIVPVVRREMQSRLQSLLQCIVPREASQPHTERILQVGEAVVAWWRPPVLILWAPADLITIWK